MAHIYQPQDLQVIGLVHTCNTFVATCPAMRRMRQEDYSFSPFELCSCPFYVKEDGTCISALYQKGLGFNIKT